MKKVLPIIAILFGWAGVYAQDFIPSDSYLYGVGMSFNEESADSVAMLSLSRSIYTRVTSESERTVSEVDGKYSDSFVKKSGLSSSIGLSGTKKAVSVNSDGQYVVYRYIDKEAYVAERIEAYSGYMQKGRDLEDVESHDEMKHRKNLVLGYYYKAYRSLADTTGMLNLFYGKERVNSLREKALKHIETAYYNGWEYIYTDPTDRLDTGSGHRVIRPYSSRFITDYLYGFEYRDNGEWKRPVAFYEKGDKYRDRRYDDDSIGEKNYCRAVISFTPKADKYGKYGFLEYRWLFEEKVNGIYVRIDVPEWMYKLKEKREIYINLNE